MRNLIWYERIAIAVVSGIAYTVVQLLLNLGSAENNIQNYLVDGLFFTIFFGFGFPLLMERLSNKQLLKIKNPVLNENESIVKEDVANYFYKYYNAIGGKLFLTQKRLIFNSHMINIPKLSFNLQLDEIASVIKIRTLGIFNNRLRIITREGVKYDFVVNNRKDWIEKIKK